MYYDVSFAHNTNHTCPCCKFRHWKFETLFSHLRKLFFRHLCHSAMALFRDNIDNISLKCHFWFHPDLSLEEQVAEYERVKLILFQIQSIIEKKTSNHLVKSFIIHCKMYHFMYLGDIFKKETKRS